MSHPLALLAVANMSFSTAIVPALRKAVSVLEGVDDEAARTLRRHINELSVFRRQTRRFWTRASRKSTPKSTGTGDEQPAGGVEGTPPTSEQQETSSEEEAVIASVSTRKTPEAKWESNAAVASTPTEKESPPVRRSYADVIVGAKPQSVVEVVRPLAGRQLKVTPTPPKSPSTNMRIAERQRKRAARQEARWQSHMARRGWLTAKQELDSGEEAAMVAEVETAPSDTGVRKPVKPPPAPPSARNNLSQ